MTIELDLLDIKNQMKQIEYKLLNLQSNCCGSALIIHNPQCSINNQQQILKKSKQTSSTLYEYNTLYTLYTDFPLYSIAFNDLKIIPRLYTSSHQLNLSARRTRCPTNRWFGMIVALHWYLNSFYIPHPVTYQSICYVTHSVELLA